MVEKNITLFEEELTHKIIGAAIEVHRILGPGLLESAYQQCLAHELTLRDLQYKIEVPIPVVYKGVDLDCGYRSDEKVILEIMMKVKYIFNREYFYILLHGYGRLWMHIKLQKEIGSSN